jgi:hypothetical protein
MSSQTSSPRRRAVDGGTRRALVGARAKIERVTRHGLADRPRVAGRLERRDELRRRVPRACEVVARSKTVPMSVAS